MEQWPALIDKQRQTQTQVPRGNPAYFTQQYRTPPPALERKLLAKSLAGIYPMLL